jgi:hypothetical protein
MLEVEKHRQLYDDVPQEVMAPMGIHFMWGFSLGPFTSTNSIPDRLGDKVDISRM